MPSHSLLWTHQGLVERSRELWAVPRWNRFPQGAVGSFRAQKPLGLGVGAGGRRSEGTMARVSRACRLCSQVLG